MAIKVDHKVDLLFKKFITGKGHRVWSGAELAPSSETILSLPTLSAEQIWNKSALIPKARNPLNADAVSGNETVISTGLSNGRISKLQVNGEDVFEKIVIPLKFQAGSLQAWAYDWENDGDASTDDLDFNSSGGANVIPDSFSADPSKYEYKLGWNSDNSEALSGTFTRNIAPGEKDFVFDPNSLIINFFALDDEANPLSVDNYFGGDNFGESVTFLEGGTLSTSDTLYILCYRYIGPLGVGSTVPVLSSTWVIENINPTVISNGSPVSVGYVLPISPVGEIEISINGVSNKVGINSPFYFSDDSGITELNSGNESIGSELFFNPASTGNIENRWDLELDDEIEIRYLQEL